MSQRTAPEGRANGQVARSARLRYVRPFAPGYRRVRRGRGFAWLDDAGRPAPGRAVRRMVRLALPPAWTDVWICRHERGHLQAIGRDAAGRRQYRYHEDWTRAVAALKFAHLGAFARRLPAIRRGISRDLGLPGLPREKVLAAIVRLLERALIRVGNDEYARANGSYGLTTLRKRHATPEGRGVRLCFPGKSRVRHELVIPAGRVANVVRSCLRLPGTELFQYRDAAGRLHDVKSGDVNRYLSGLAGMECSAKDFRTWAATVLMHRELCRLVPATSVAARRRQVRAALAAVAGELRNTVAVCRRAYVHPGVIRAFDGPGWRRRAPRGAPFARTALSASERATLAVLGTPR